MRLARVLALVLVGLLLLVTAAAHARMTTTTDEAGDGQHGRALDITSVKLDNREHAIVATIKMVRATRGDLYVFLWARGEAPDQVTRVQSRHRARGNRNTVATIDGTQTCPRLKVTWNHEIDRAKIRVPSGCFSEGDYRAVRARAITEIGSDADYAPKTETGDWGWTRWTRRG